MKKLMSFIHGGFTAILLVLIWQSVNKPDQKPGTFVMGTDSPGLERSRIYRPDTIIIDTILIDGHELHRIKAYINTPLNIVKP